MITDSCREGNPDVTVISFNYYEAENDFTFDMRVDVINWKDGMVEAWIYGDGLGVKELMWGENLDDNKRTLDDFIRLVIANADEYAKLYWDNAY